ncbi:MAG: hypothetical protein JNK10_15555, partial [Cyclobacteriaceae bacterium]|nr:hypothetical protein [Cyclobacteriaceae bacterium]
MKRVFPLFLAALLGGLAAIALHDRLTGAKAPEMVSTSGSTAGPQDVRFVNRPAGGVVSAMPDFVD